MVWLVTSQNILPQKPRPIFQLYEASTVPVLAADSRCFAASSSSSHDARPAALDERAHIRWLEVRG